LPYGTGLTLTTARYYTPFGRSLQRDYSSGSIYDYYSQHQAEGDSAPKPAGSPVTLPDGRTLFGGRGIEPDIKVPAAEFSAARARVNDAAFYFVRQLVAGKVAGFESYKVEKQNHRMDLSPGEFAVTDKLFEAFRSFTSAQKESGLTAENIDRDAEYARTRLRQEIATANNSNEAGIRVLLEADPQVIKAAELMPDARKLVDKNLAMN
jgi:carboxyl-terminal processing protease